MTKFPSPPALSNLLQQREKRVPYFSYKLAGEDQFARYGLDVTFPEQMDIDESSMSVWIPFADGNRRDGVGDLLEVGGIRLDRHRKNPIVLFDHGKQVQLPIALAFNPDTKEYTVQIDPVTRSGRMQAFFYDGRGQDGIDRTKDYQHALFCEQLFDLVCKGFIRGGSIGYQVIKALELPPDYERGIPKGLHLLVTLMLEGSLVVMPANADTVRKGMSTDQMIDFWQKNTVETAKEILAKTVLCGKSLSPYLVKSLEPYAEGKAINWFRSGKIPTEYGVEKAGQRYFVMEGTPGQMRDTGEGLTRGGALGPSGRAHDTQESAQQSVMRHRQSGKNTSAIRQKYHNLKSLRRRIKSSKPGSSIVHISSKNMKRAVDSANQKGLKFQNMGERNGNTKIKLTGDDNVIDEFAREFGRPMMAQKKKATPKSQVGKTDEKASKERPKTPVDHIVHDKPGKREVMTQTDIRKRGGEQYSEHGAFHRPKTQLGKKKALEDETQEVMDPINDIEDAADGGEAQEPYGAQLLRRMHQDAAILLGEYDDFVRLNENERVGKILQGNLEYLTDCLEEIEGLFANEYPEAPPLEGAESFDEEESSEEEMLEEDAIGDEVEDAVEDGTVGDKDGPGEEMGDRGMQAVAADSDEDVDGEYEEEEEDDDILEGIGMGEKRFKSLRRKYGKSAEGDEFMRQEVSRRHPNYSDDEVAGAVGRERRARDTLATPERRGYGPGSRPMRVPKEPTTHVPKKGMKAKDEINPAREPSDDPAGFRQLPPTRRYEVTTASGTRNRPDESKQPANKKPTRGRGSSPVGERSGKGYKMHNDSGICENCGMAECDCPDHPMSLGLEGHERRSVGEATKYLSDVSQPNSIWDDEKRMTAYHYGKTLDGMVTLDEIHEELNEDPREETDIPAAEFDPGVGAKAGPDIVKRPGSSIGTGFEYGADSLKNPKAGQQEGRWHTNPKKPGDPQEFRAGGDNTPLSWEKVLHPHRKMCKGASEFFNRLSQTRDFGDPHREECKYWHRNLDPIAKEEDIESDDLEDEVIEDEYEEEEENMEVGETDEKVYDPKKDELRGGRGQRRVGAEGKPSGARLPGKDDTGPALRPVAGRTTERTSGKRPGPGARPMRVPKEPTTHVPKKSLDNIALAKEIEAQNKAMQELQQKLESLSF